MKYIPVLLAVALGLATSASYAGRTYKWVDDQGVVHYTQHPPRGRQAEIFNPHSSAVSEESANARLEALTEKVEAAQEARELKDDILSQELARRERIKKNCQIARKNLVTLETAARVQDKDEGGNPYFLDDGQKQARIAETKQQVETYCN